MKRFFDRAEKQDGVLESSTAEKDELQYLVDRENSIVTSRQFHAWIDTSLQPSGTQRKKYNTRSALISSRIVEDDIPNDESLTEKNILTVKQKTVSHAPPEIFAPDASNDAQNNSIAEQGEGDQDKFLEPEDEDELPDPDDPLDDGELLLSEDLIQDDAPDTAETDWLELAGEADEFECDITPELEEVETTGAVSTADRALQAAIEIGGIFSLERKEILAIADIFEKNGWAACRQAINRELESGTTVDELYLAAEIKEIWKDHYEFYSSQISNYTVLSWPTALKLANSFYGYPDPAEVEQLLIHLHQHWITDTIQRLSYTNFNQYLIGYVNQTVEGFEHAQIWSIGMEEYYDEEYFLPPSTTDIPQYHDYELERALRTVRLSNIY